MKILIIEPYFTGSHKKWAQEFQKYSKHDINFLTLPGRYWKWRMHGGAITLAQKFNNLDTKPDIIITTDMLNLPLFKSIANTKDIPIAMYFHENQITYPWSPNDRDIVKERDHHYGFINYSSSLVSTINLFNSDFHRNSYINSLKNFLSNFPDHNDLSNIDLIKLKSKTLHLGIDLKKFDSYKPKEIKNTEPLILWNHRWEHDKNPNDFIDLIDNLNRKNLDFKCILLGQNNEKKSGYFDEFIRRFPERIFHAGYCESFKEYASLLWKADICPITSIQDFFGISIAEAAYCNTQPLLPNRLAYPEIYKEDRSLFYNNHDDLIIKTEKLIIKKNMTHKSSEIIKNYDWSNMINQYDLFFENLY